MKVGVLDKLLEDIPDYQVFMTAEEMESSSRQLAEEYPEKVSLFEFGHTTNGKPLYCMKIGNHGSNALMLGCPHPNEPFGAMMLEYFSRKLVEDEELLNELGYTWYIVKMCDRDGVELNEKWYVEPMSMENYARYFFRPASNRQPEWTFPVVCKEYSFDKPMEETKALISLMEAVKPRFMYVLHNSGYGGVYWYVSKEMPEIYQDFYVSAASQGFSVQSDGESDIGMKFAPAISKITGVEEMYEYNKRQGEEIKNELNYGTCSASYCKRIWGTDSLITEIPFFYTPQLEDYSDTDRELREIELEKLDFCVWSDEFIKTILDEVRPIVSSDNPYLLMLLDFIAMSDKEEAVKRVINDPANKRLATHAELCQEIYITKFLKLLNHASLIRLLDSEMMGRQTDTNVLELLKECKQKAEQTFCKVLQEVEDGVEYRVVPIKSAVRVQLESGLRFAEIVKNEKGEI